MLLVNVNISNNNPISSTELRTSVQSKTVVTRIRHSIVLDHYQAITFLFLTPVTNFVLGASYLNEPEHKVPMHAHHTALPVSVPGRLQFIEASLKSFSVHHVFIVGVCLFDRFVDRTENEIVKFRTSNFELSNRQITGSLNRDLYICRRVSFFSRLGCVSAVQNK